MVMNSFNLISKRKYPSPNPKVRLYMVEYLSSGLRVKGMMAEPDDGEKYEGFLYLRGGIKRIGMVRPARIAQFASEGFIVFAPFYRGNEGGEGNEDFAGDDREDALSAFDLLKDHPRVKDGKIHVFGFSRGGVMALLTGIHRPETSSIVTWGGVSDMHLTYKERKDLRRMMKRVIGGTPNKFPERYDWRTPIQNLEPLRAPVLIIHGALDNNVSVEHAKLLENQLKKLGKSHETWYFNEYTHYFPPSVNRQVVQNLTSWMKSQSRSS